MEAFVCVFLIFATDLKGFVFLASVIIARKENKGKSCLLFQLVFANFRKGLSAEISNSTGRNGRLKPRKLLNQLDKSGMK